MDWFRSRCRIRLVFQLLFACLLLFGCNQKKMVVVKPTLADQVEIPVTYMEDIELKDFLDEAYENPYDRKDFWEPKMEQALQAKIEALRSPTIPREHLKYFLQSYHNRGHKIHYFNQATWMWFEGILNGDYPYRPEDKRFLEEYINNCLNSKHKDTECIKLSEEVVCKLDSELCKIFENQSPFGD
jgi:hypothetical protein